MAVTDAMVEQGAKALFFHNGGYNEAQWNAKARDGWQEAYRDAARVVLEAVDEMKQDHDE